MNDCPYHANGKLCSHKGCMTNRKNKSICPYNNENKCEMYKEWQKQRKVDENPLKYELEALQ